MREITPSNNNGSIQLKFSLGGKRYSFNPVPGGDYSNKRELATAQAIATKIYNDILAGCFDPTLQRYRLVPKVAASNDKPKTLLELWDTWVDSLDLPEATKACHYKLIRRMLEKADSTITDTSWLTSSKLAPVTYNQRLCYVKSFGKWLVAEERLKVSPFERLKPRKATRKEVKPFSSEEIRLIVAGFEQQESHYVPFVKFLFITGVRLSEAIGLRWQHVDFDRNELVIKESLSRDRTQENYRIRKETKTGSVRYLSMSQELRALLLGLKPSKDRDSLVFKSPKGYVIDADNFRDQYWRQVLLACEVPYRKPHTIRHTTLSHAIEQGTPLTGVAYLAGHSNTRMVMETYGHMINRPKLPDMPV